MKNLDNRLEARAAFLLGGMLAVIFATAACQQGPRTTSAAGPPPPVVSVVEVNPENVPIYHEYTAETYARDMVEVRGRVDGYIEERRFQIGSDVKAGDVLFVLDRRPYQADVAKAKSDVDQSQANHDFATRNKLRCPGRGGFEAGTGESSQGSTGRRSPASPGERGCGAQQDLDNAVAALQANEASVNSRKANVEQARLQTGAQIDTTAAQTNRTKRSSTPRSSTWITPRFARPSAGVSATP